jgi:tRNA pseudouridine synthase 10
MSHTQPDRILQVAEQMLGQYALCDRCLGRQFAMLSTMTTNRQRGQALKLSLALLADARIKEGDKENGQALLQSLAGRGMFEPAAELCGKHSLDFEHAAHCHLCDRGEGSVFEMISSLAERAVSQLEGVEFTNILVGTVPDTLLTEREDELRGKYGLLYGEAFKSHFNRELGKVLTDILGKDPEFKNPDIVVVYDVEKDEVRINISPLFIYGRYRKLKRGIPQSRWDCGECNGRGCESCGGTGRKYQDSVSEYVGIPAQQAAKGTRFKFHAAGREDIDALMLGEGRPFVVEVSKPRIRSPDLKKLTKTINKRAKKKVEVLDLAISQRSKAQDLKSEASENIKEYTALITTDSDVTDDQLRDAERKLIGTQLEQRTPNRVAHRRSDLVRPKRVFDVRLSRKSVSLLEGFFRVQGGTYVKELISGDNGRTVPSLAGALGVGCKCIELNVIAIHAAPPDHNL